MQTEMQTKTYLDGLHEARHAVLQLALSRRDGRFEMHWEYYQIIDKIVDEYMDRYRRDV